MTESVQLNTPGGRLVMGSLSEKQTKDMDGRPIPLEKQRYFFGLAVPKTAPEFQQIWETIYGVAANAYANNAQVLAQIQAGLPGRFAWKIQDGDVTTHDPKTGAAREIKDYMRGNFILKFGTMFEMDACALMQDGTLQQIPLSDIKIGDYADIVFNVASNNQVGDQAGVYLNPVAIRRLGYGQAIAQGVSATSAFANIAPSVPQGASQMPVGNAASSPAAPMPAPAAPAPAAPAAAPIAPVTAPSPAAVPAPAAPIASPSSGVPPHPGIMNPPQ